MKHINSIRITVVFLTLFIAGSYCKLVNAQSSSSPANTLTQEQKEDGWTLLFDGKTTNGWREVWGTHFPDENWVVRNGTLTVLASNGEQGGSGGSIVTKNEYSDFEFRADFKLTKAANSGIKYFVVEDKSFFKTNPNLSKGMGIGLEYQVLDDKNHPDAHEGVNGNRTTASLYDMIPASKDKHLNPPGEWNHAKIISKGNHVEHWLNGEKVLEYERGSDAFRALVDNSKYRYKNFGLAPKGHILLQNHGTEVSFKNVMIKKL